MNDFPAVVGPVPAADMTLLAPGRAPEASKALLASDLTLTEALLIMESQVPQDPMRLADRLLSDGRRGCDARSP